MEMKQLCEKHLRGNSFSSFELLAPSRLLAVSYYVNNAPDQILEILCLMKIFP